MHSSVQALLEHARRVTADSATPVRSLKELRSQLGVSSATMTNWTTRGISKEGAITAEAIYKIPASTLRPDLIAARDVTPAKYLVTTATPLRDAPRTSVDQDLPPAQGVAQSMSQARPIVELPRYKWEQLMTAELNQPFELVVEDDALMPDIYRGCIARLDPYRAPEPGWPVLVKTRDGNYYLRDYQSGSGGRWMAVARATRGYAPLDSEADGLEVVATLRGYDRP